MPELDPVIITVPFPNSPLLLLMVGTITLVAVVRGLMRVWDLIGV